MHLFTRQAMFARDQIADGLAYAVDIAQYVGKTTGLEVNAWAALYGAPLGTVSWSARVDSQAAMGAASATLLADAGYQKRLAANLHRFDGHAEDLIGEVVAVSGDASPSQYVTIVTAQCALGKIADSMAWGVDIMQHAAKLSGAASTLVRGLYGPFGTLVWLATYDSLEQVDKAGAALSSDPAYLERLDQGGDLFVPGSGTQRLIQRLS